MKCLNNLLKVLTDFFCLTRFRVCMLSVSEKVKLEEYSNVCKSLPAALESVSCIIVLVSTYYEM